MTSAVALLRRYLGKRIRQRRRPWAARGHRFRHRSRFLMFMYRLSFEAQWRYWGG